MSINDLINSFTIEGFIVIKRYHEETGVGEVLFEGDILELGEYVWIDNNIKYMYPLKRSTDLPCIVFEIE